MWPHDGPLAGERDTTAGRGGDGASALIGAACDVRPEELDGLARRGRFLHVRGPGVEVVVQAVGGDVVVDAAVEDAVAVAADAAEDAVGVVHALNLDAAHGRAHSIVTGHTCGREPGKTAGDVGELLGDGVHFHSGLAGAWLGLSYARRTHIS